METIFLPVRGWCGLMSLHLLCRVAGGGIPEIQDVLISNLNATGAKTAIAAEGFADKPIHNVRFQNVTIVAPSAGNIKNARLWKCEKLVVCPQDGKPFVQVNCQSVELPVISPKPLLQASFQN